jgi:uncharacterized damage-inducible protein DinB
VGGALLAYQFSFSQRALGTNLDGISDEESRVRPATGGNSINWVVGHIVASRQGVLSLLGQERTWSREQSEGYARGSSGDVPEGSLLPLARLLADLNTTTQIITAALNALPDQAIAAPSTNPEQTLGQRLAFLAFHESYHVGQIGLLRRLSGKPGAIR